MLIEILVFVFVLFAWTRALLRFKEKKLDFKQLFFWTVIWLGISVAVFFQDWTTRISQLLGIGRGSDFVVYVSVVLLFYLMFRLYVKAEKIEQDLTKVVRKVALDKMYEKKKK